ncbi:hypothetical protein [Microvirga terricola]|uniref:Uncharacterized protein n=1 Tax=Microvirga terricola TaxID=2719797 RepID=A0ABX0VDG2_9HYPH|nr:hypothetical protein [Microvirga terricola]NIX77707.1 hypothetical protein [Microvirga terricola]
MKASSLFLRTGALAALCGIALGISMAIAQDHTLHSVHAHINLVGWASMFLFGLYYHVVPAADSKLAKIHYYVALPGFLVMIAGVTGIHLGKPEMEPLAGVGSLLTLASMLIFVWNVFATTKSVAASKPAVVATAR